MILKLLSRFKSKVQDIDVTEFLFVTVILQLQKPYGVRKVKKSLLQLMTGVCSQQFLSTKILTTSLHSAMEL